MTGNTQFEHEPTAQHEPLADVTLYALGAFSGPDRDRVREHIEGCVLCRDELVRVTGVRTLLGRLTTSAAPGPVALVPAMSAEAPPAVLRERVVNQVLVSRQAQSRRRRWLVSTGVVAALVLVAVPTAVAVHAGASSTTAAAAPADPSVVVPAFQPMQVAASAGSATASAATQAQTWGTSITIRATDFQPGSVIDLYVVRADGRQEKVGSWQAGPGTIICAASTWYPRDQLLRLEARAQGGDVVA